MRNILQLIVLLMISSKLLGDVHFFPERYDLGRVLQYETIDGLVTIKNESGMNIVIDKVQSECGMAVIFEETKLMSGEYLEVPFSFETQGRIGILERRLQISIDGEIKDYSIFADVNRYAEWDIKPDKIEVTEKIGSTNIEIMNINEQKTIKRVEFEKGRGIVLNSSIVRLVYDIKEDFYLDNIYIYFEEGDIISIPFIKKPSNIEEEGILRECGHYH